MVKGQGATTPTPGNGNGGETPEITSDTGLSDEGLAQEDQRDEQAKPDTAQETEGGVEQRESSPQRVMYRGIGSRRRISAAQWKSAGVNDQGDVEWNRLNKFTVAVGGDGGLSDNALNLIKDEAEFSVE